MSSKETKLMMSLCQQMFGYTPETVADFAAFCDYIDSVVDHE